MTALAVCAWLAARRSPAWGYLGAAVTAVLASIILTWASGWPAPGSGFMIQHRMPAEFIFGAALLLAVAAGCAVGAWIGRITRPDGA